MKSSKSIRQQYGNTERGKSGKRSDKLSKLDRKSSRGMIYENEELRLRTININAEVERGQTDIKSLRKENEKLRREIWTLRDECDRLNKKVKAKFIEHDQNVYSVRCSGGNGGNNCSTQCNEGGCGCDVQQCKYNSEDSDSCDSCCCHEEAETPCTEDCCNETKKLPDIAEHEKSAAVVQNDTSNVTAAEGPVTGPSILTNFDHLSVVSEETLSNSEVVMAQQSENLLGYTPDLSGSQITLPSLVGPLTPLTPVELVANELNDLQAVVPPLSYFENILSEHMNSNYGSTPESSSTTFSGKTIVKHTNGWDYNLESPFAQRRFQANSISPILTKRSVAQTLTTFVPTTTVTPPPADNVNSKGKPTLPKKPTDLSIISTQYKPIIETVPITTMAPNGCVTTTHLATTTNNDGNSDGNNDGNTTPKHFFAPIKPKLKLNTALANQKRLPPPPIPIVPTPPPPISSSASSTVAATQDVTQSYNSGTLEIQSRCEPPDIYVTNALVTPYKPPSKPTMQPPPIPQRVTTSTTIHQQQKQAQVSSTSRQHQRNRQQQPQQHHRRQQHYQIHHYQHQQHNNVVESNNDVSVTTRKSVTITTTTATTATTISTTNTLCCSMPATNFETFLTTTATTVLTSNTLCYSLNPLLTTSLTTASTTLTTTATTNSILTSPSTMTATELLLTSGPCSSSATMPACFKFINSNINFHKPNDPVYAIAQNVCHNLITAPAVTQPLMSSIVKCCIAKQEQLQQLITATAMPSSSAAAAAILHGGGSNNIVAIQPLPSSSSAAILTSISCNLTINSPFKTNPITTLPSSSLTMSTTSTNCIVVDSMCQTDSANLESILNDIEAISEDILAIQLVKHKSRENLNNRSMEPAKATPNSALQQTNKNTKPYRSEMNLLLTYEGDNPTIKEAVITNLEQNLESGSNTSTTRRTRSLERDHTDSPSPHIPDPMQPFPENRKYIGFDRVNRAAVLAQTAPNVAATATQTSPVLNSPLSQRSHLPVSPLVTNVNIIKSPNGKSLPPIPPQRVYPPSLDIKCAGIARSTSVSNGMITTTIQPTTNSSILSGVPPNKSQLYAALANAAAKRAQFRSQPTHLTESLDLEVPPEIISDNDANEDDKEAIDNAKRKAKRVSIVCADTDSPGTPDKPLPAMRSQSSALPVQTTANSGSCSDLQNVVQNPALRSLKQTSQSTPNSPHSSRKHEGSPLGTPTVPPVISVTPSSTPTHNRNNSHTSSVHQQPTHYHGHSSSYPNVVSPLSQQHIQPRKNSQDTIKASAAEIACAAANAMRSKCSRRHSDGTVSHTNQQRISGVSGGTNGTHHHAHHNHHHHQHSSSVASNANPHHSHHSRQDSNQETVASSSDRNSNSLASSRESSASFSLRSQRRKLSVSSHTGGKIPWCGCWGNGCL